MENSTKKSGGVVIPKRKRSLDLKSLYECKSSETGVIKKKDSGENEQEDVKKKKRKNRKEVPLSSLEPDAKKIRKDDRNGTKSELGFREKLDAWSKELHGISFSLGDYGSPFNIPKRPRGSVGRKKLESDQDSEPLRISDSVERVGAFKAEVSKSEDEGGPTKQLIRSVTFSAGKHGISKPRLTGKVVDSHTKSKRKVEYKSTMNSRSSSVKLKKKVGSDEGIDRVGAFKVEVTKSEDKCGHSGQSASPLTLYAGNHVTLKDLGLKKKSNRKGDPKYTMNSSNSNVKLKKKVGDDEGVDHVGEFEAEVSKSEDKGGPTDQSGCLVTISAGSDMVKVIDLSKKSKRKAEPKSTMNSSSSNVKLKKKVRADETIDHVGAFEAEVTKLEDVGGLSDKSGRSGTLSVGNGVAGKVGVNKKSKSKGDPGSTMKFSNSNVKLKKKVDTDECNDHSVRLGTFSAGKDVARKVVGISKKSKQSKRKADSKFAMNTSSSNVKLKKKVGADEVVDCVEEFEAEVTISEGKSDSHNQSVRPVALSAGNDVTGKAVGLSKTSKRKADPKSSMNLSTSNMKLKKKMGDDEAIDRVGAFETECIKFQDNDGPDDQLVRLVTLAAGNDVVAEVVGSNKKSKRKGDLKSTKNSSSSNLKLKVGTDEAIDHVRAFESEVTKPEDKGGFNDQSVRSVTFSAGNNVVGKIADLNKKSNWKADRKSTIKGSSSNVKLKKKVGSDEVVDHVGEFEARVTISADKSSPDNESVRSVTDLSVGNNVAGKVVAVNKKSKRKADPKSSMNFSTSNMKLKKKMGDDESTVRVGAFEAECINSKDNGGPDNQLVRLVSLAAGEDDISNMRLSGKVVGSSTKSKRKPDSKSTTTSSSSNKKLKKVGADEAIVRVGASKAEVIKPQDKVGSNDQLVGPVTLSAGNDDVSNSILAGKVVGSNTKSKRKAGAKSTMNASSSNGKLKQKVGADEIKGKLGRQSDSVRHVVKESNLVVNNGEEASSTKRPSNSRKKKDLVVGGDGVEASVKKCGLAVGSSIPNSSFIDSLDEDDDDDEENLEQNAARMLSSRFDPSCTGFASKKKYQTVDELSLPVSCAPDSISQQPKSLSCGESDSGDDNKELRPRGGGKGKIVSRKRRHFYEIPARDLDPSWFLNRRVKIFWPLDESWYYGYVKNYHSEAKLHHLKYDDGEEEWVDLDEENFRLLLLRSEVPGKGKSRKRCAAAKDTHAEQTAPPADDDNCVGDDDSEPIASWLACQFQRAKALSKSSKRRKISQSHLPLFSSSPSGKTDNSNGDANVLEHSGEDPGCETTSADKLLGLGTVDKSYSKQAVYVRKKFQKSAGNTSVSRDDKAPGSALWPVTKGDMFGCGCVEGSGKQLWSFDDRSKFTLNGVLLEYNEFSIQICLPLLPYLEFSCGIGLSRMFHDNFMLQHGVIMTTSPAVFLEMLFIDSNLGLRSFLFEGCLVQALAIVFLFLTLFSHSDENCNGELKLPVTSISFQLSSVHDLRKQHVFAFHSFSGLERSKWLYVESKILQQCVLIKQLSVLECTYGNIRELECGILQPCKSRVGSELFSREHDLRNESERLVLPMGVSEEAFNTEKPANVPQFTPSISAAPNSCLSLHLQSLMEHGSAVPNLQHQDPLRSPESSGNGGELVVEEPVGECSHFTEREHRQLDSEASALRGLSIYQQDSEIGVVLASNATEDTNSFDKLQKGLPSDQQADMPFSKEGSISRQTSDASWNVHDGFVLSSSTVGSKSSSKRRKSSTISSLLGQHSPVSADSQPNFMHNGFSNGPKKPRTQVQYTLPFAGYDFSIRQETSSMRSVPCKRIRRASLKRISDGSGNNQKSMELVTCFSNVLVTHGDKGWRECGAHIMLEVSDHNEWRLAIKLSGVTKFSYKVTHILQPGSTNRYSHAVIWKGGKDWVLEFPDRSQWMLFKELYEECYNRNLRAASVKNIPIPGVHPVDEGDDYGDELPFARDPTMYIRQVQTDAEMAMDPSHILYDMDSDDELWLATHKNCTDKHKYEEISEEFFEMAMDMFEKNSYAQRRDNLTEAEIEELAIVIGSVEAAKLIYLHWQLKREKMCMPLIRHLQPPPWQRYQKQLKEWENNVSRSIHEKFPPPEKPPMFAFCFKPRGLDVPKPSKQRSHRKLSVSGLHASGDHGLLVSGRRSNGHAYGDEKALYASTIHDSSDFSPSLHPSTRVLSSRDAHFTLSASVSEWKLNNNHRKSHKNKHKKKLGSYPRRTGDGNNNAVQQWNLGPSEVPSQNYYYFDGPHGQGVPKQPDISDLHEFHVRDALGSSKHARTVAKLKRERAQRLFSKADFAINRAVSALMQAEAIKDSFGNSNGVVS